MQISISYPSNLKCLLKENQIVDFNTPYLERQVTTDIKIPVAKKLAINPTHIFRYLKKFVGETINKGEVLAIKKGLLTTKKVLSDYQGIIKEIDHNKGTLTISISQENTTTINAFFKGQVLEIKKREIILKVKKRELFPVKTASDNFGGEIFYLSNHSSSLSSSRLSKKILLSDTITAYLQSKIEALGVKGFVLLTKLPQPSDLYFAQIKNIDDFKKIIKLNFPYCLIDKENSTIYFYL